MKLYHGSPTGGIREVAQGHSGPPLREAGAGKFPSIVAGASRRHVVIPQTL